jgi:hypothetical protein
MNECKHPKVILYWRLYAMATRYEPEEWEGRAQCQECGHWMDPADIPEDAEVKEITK